MQTFTPADLLVALCVTLVLFVPFLAWLAIRPHRDRSIQLWFVGQGVFAMAFVVVGYQRNGNYLTACLLVLALLMFCEALRHELREPTLLKWPVIGLFALFCATQVSLDLLDRRLVMGAPVTSLGLVLTQLFLLVLVVKLRRRTGSKGLLIVILGVAQLLLMNLVRGTLTAMQQVRLELLSLDLISCMTIAMFTLAALQFTLGFLVYQMEKIQQERVGQAQAFATEQARLEQTRKQARLLEDLVAQRNQMIMLNSRFGALSSLSLYASGIVHDISSPLQALLLELENLRHLLPEGAEAPARKLDKVMELTQKMSKVLTGLRQLMTQQELATEAMAMTEVMEDLGHIITGEARRRQVELQINTPREDAAHQVRCNKVLLERMLINIVGNAMQALREAENGRIDVTVQVEQRQGQPWAVFRVQDNGPGFDEQVLLSAATRIHTTKEAGMGVGLYMARMIVEDWGGRLELYNNLSPGDSGATVEIWLPLLAEAAPQA